MADKGKRGGVRVIYFNLTEPGIVVLIAIYTKAGQTNILASDIKKAV